jgi:phosphoglycerol transferase MdoB-like AlkP superfamily enzyme
MGLALSWLAATVLLTHLQARGPARSDIALVLRSVFPALWLFGATVGLTLCFSDRADLGFWPGAGWLLGSCAATGAVIVLLLPERLRRRVAGAVVLCSASLLLGDLVYIRYFGTVIPIAALASAGQLASLGGSVAALLQPMDVVLGVWAIAGLVLVIRPPSASESALAPARRRLYGWVFGFPLGLWALVSPLTFATAYGPDNPTRIVVQKNLLNHWGVFNVHAFDIFERLRDSAFRRSLEPAGQTRIDGVLADRASDHPDTEDAWFGRARGANLLLIHLESVQGFAVGGSLNGQPITPFFDRWAQTEAMRFEQIFDQTAQGRTSDAQFLVLNGLHPFAKGSIAHQRADNDFVALPGLLQKAGYHTAAYFPYERGFWNTAALFQAWGFEQARYRSGFKPGDAAAGEVVGWGLADHIFFKQVLPDLVSAPTPALHYLVPLSLHHPYEAFPEVLARLDVGPLQNTALGNYLQSVRHLDASIQALLTDLSALGQLENTLVVLYGDHDAGLDMTEDIQAIGGEWEGPALLADRVPLLIRLPDGSVAGTVDTVGGQIDVAPTVLHLLGLPRPLAMVGTSLLPARRRVAVLPNGSAVGPQLAWLADGALHAPEMARQYGTGQGAQSLCWDRVAGSPVDAAECAALALYARDELRAARDIVWFDLARSLADGQR